MPDKVEFNPIMSREALTQTAPEVGASLRTSSVNPMQPLKNSYKGDRNPSESLISGSPRISIEHLAKLLQAERNYPPFLLSYPEWQSSEWRGNVQNMPSLSDHGFGTNQLQTLLTSGSSQSLADIQVNFNQQRQANSQLEEYQDYIVGLDYGLGDKMAISVVGIDEDGALYFVHSFVPQIKNMPSFLQLAITTVSYFGAKKVGINHSSFTRQISEVVQSSITDKAIEIRELPSEGNLKVAVDLRTLILIGMARLYIPSNMDLINKFIDYYSFLLGITQQINPVNKSSVLQALINAIAICPSCEFQD